MDVGGGPPWRGPIVGNGGFSLRSRRLNEALRSIEMKSKPDDWPLDERLNSREFYGLSANGNKFLVEDVLISLWYRDQLEQEFGIKFCPPELANKFSVETVCPFTEKWLGRSFGFHGIRAAPYYGFNVTSSAHAPGPEGEADILERARSAQQAGNLPDAAQLFKKRAEVGGDDEAVWYARWQRARCMLALGDERGFLREALVAFNQRPDRAEPLYDLARFHRERGMHETAMHFAETGIALARPQGNPKFVEDFVYQWGFQEEVSISGFYCRDPARKERGCRGMQLARAQSRRPGGPALGGGIICASMRSPRPRSMPSFIARRVEIGLPEGWHATNPSVARRGDDIVMVQRAVNYVLEDGKFRTPNGAPLTTRNFLLRLTAALDTEASMEILPPSDFPAPACERARGFEDMRLFAWHGALWCIATLSELTPEGWCQQVLARIEDSGDGPCRLADWRVLEPEGPRRNEKNWMPLVDAAPAEAEGERLRFIYLCDPTRLVDETARTVAETVPTIVADEFRGGTQAIAFAGGWLALIHEVLEGATSGAGSTIIASSGSTGPARCAA